MAGLTVTPAALGQKQPVTSWTSPAHPAGAAHLWAGTTAVAEEVDVERRWLILATTDAVLPCVYGVLPWVCKAVRGSTAAFPTAALPHFT